MTNPVPNLSAWPRARDEARILLESAAEAEHVLMVQYLYAVRSLKNKREVSDPAQKRALDDTSDRSWPHTLLAIAHEEMGQLMTVQNLLLVLGVTPNLEREDFRPAKPKHGRPVAVLMPAHQRPRRSSQLPALTVTDTFDDPLPAAEIGGWEGNS